ncbi:MAG: hypothetical protein D6681_09765, partial [Calditrichaeota bacterium]
NGWAEPYAPKVKITQDTSPMGRMFINMANVPDKSVVGIPPYPGAVVLQTRGAGEMKVNGKPYLPYIKLLTADSIDKVVSWYKAKLPSWQYQKVDFMGAVFHRFWKVKGNYEPMDMDAMGTIPNVVISDGKQHADDYPAVKTMIEITYQPE